MFRERLNLSAYGTFQDLFFSADQAKPLALLRDKKADAKHHFTYAVGTLVLWSADKNLIDNNATALRELRFNKLAVANARLAPYGVAAMEVLEALKLTNAVNARLVRGENISQTYQFASSGNAELGFVARVGDAVHQGMGEG